MCFVVGYESFGIIKASLKHKILSFTFFEEDEQIPNIIQEYFQRNTNCSDLIGRSERCLEDDVVNWVHEDGEFKECFFFSLTLQVENTATQFTF